MGTFMASIVEQERRHPRALKCLFLLSPYLDELSVHQMQYCCGLKLLICPIATFPDNSFTPHFKTFPWNKALRRISFHFFIRIPSPMHLLELSVTEENNEVSTFSTQRYKKQTRYHIET